MNAEPSLWSFISHASPVVQCVLILLMAASVASWTIIIQRLRYFKQIRNDANAFQKSFWASDNLQEFFQHLNKSKDLSGLARVFHAGFNEFQRLHETAGFKAQASMDGAQRAMRIASTQEIDVLEQHLGFLATVGSTSPYVGLFGTVWGIMSAFRALGTAGQATIAMVAPGIAEALIATAIGLFAAIPAVVAYNRFSNQLEQINGQYETFQEEVAAIFHREAFQA